MTQQEFVLPFDALHHHIGHAIEISCVWSWESNADESIEIRCRDNGCADCEPLVEVTNPRMAA